jgi:PAS domain-containing protein
MAVSRSLFSADSGIRRFMDAIPSYVFLTDEDVRILDHNRAAAELLGPNPEAVLRRLCGEAFRCINDESAPDGCGTGEECPDCVIRNSVKAAAEGQRPLRRHAELSIQRDGQITPIHLWVTVSALEYNSERVFIVSLEDVTELVTLRQLLPICSNCKRVRNDGQYWEQIDDYLRQHTTIEFTHSICPDCARILYADYAE